MCAPTNYTRPAWMDEPTKPYKVTAPYGEDLGVWDCGPSMLESLRATGHKVARL